MIVVSEVPAYSTGSHQTVSLIQLQWVPEITHHCPKTPFLLVGTQMDLRDDSGAVEKVFALRII